MQPTARVAARALLGAAVAPALIACGGSTSEHAPNARVLGVRVDEPTTISSLGLWTLEKLGSGPLLFEHVTRTASYTVPYVLPPGAKQGPRRWYEIRLHVRVTIGAGTGRFYIFAAHNGYASAMIKYAVSASRASRRAERTSVSYIDGSVHRTVPFSADTLVYRNYLQYRGVQAGLNKLTFSVEVDGALAVDRVEILQDSGINYTTASPARLSIALHDGGDLKRGVATSLNVVVANHGSRIVREAVVTVDYPHDQLRLIGPATKHRGDLRRGVAKRTSFRVVPLVRGRVLIGISAGGRGGNRPAISRGLRIR